jgi:hypothetical protein
MTGSGEMLQPDTRQGKRHERHEPSVGEKQLRPAYAVPASWEMRMMGNVFFKDSDSHVSTGSGFGSVSCRQSVRRSVGASHLSPRGQRADKLFSPSFA